jgi:hypothetical protein
MRRIKRLALWALVVFLACCFIVTFGPIIALSIAGSQPGKGLFIQSIR